MRTQGESPPPNPLDVGACTLNESSKTYRRIMADKRLWVGELRAARANQSGNKRFAGMGCVHQMHRLHKGMRLSKHRSLIRRPLRSCFPFTVEHGTDSIVLQNGYSYCINLIK
jgi:hypothetical protein